MIITSEDRHIYAEIGNYEIINCFYSTIIINLKNDLDGIGLAINFLENGHCKAQDCIETAREFNLIRDRLSLIPVDMLVYDMNTPSKKAPWHGNISPIVTSCGNFFTTADGKDMIFEINKVLCYASIKRISVLFQ